METILAMLLQYFGPVGQRNLSHIRCIVSVNVPAEFGRLGLRLESVFSLAARV